MVPTAKVILVDDEPFMARAVANVLTAGGIEVIVCQEWAGVAHAIRTANPDLVLLDYNMPSLKGDSICEILKRNRANDAMKIVLFSSEALSELSGIASKCGADGVIAKNTAPDELVRRVRALTADSTAAIA